MGRRRRRAKSLQFCAKINYVAPDRLYTVGSSGLFPGKKRREKGKLPLCVCVRKCGGHFCMQTHTCFNPKRKPLFWLFLHTHTLAFPVISCWHAKRKKRSCCPQLQLKKGGESDCCDDDDVQMSGKKRREYSWPRSVISLTPLSPFCGAPIRFFGKTKVLLRWERERERVTFPRQLSWQKNKHDKILAVFVSWEISIFSFMNVTVYKKKKLTFSILGPPCSLPSVGKRADRKKSSKLGNYNWSHTPKKTAIQTNNWNNKFKVTFLCNTTIINAIYIFWDFFWQIVECRGR